MPVDPPSNSTAFPFQELGFLCVDDEEESAASTSTTQPSCSSSLTPSAELGLDQGSHLIPQITTLPNVDSWLNSPATSSLGANQQATIASSGFTALQPRPLRSQIQLEHCYALTNEHFNLALQVPKVILDFISKGRFCALFYFAFLAQTIAQRILDVSDKAVNSRDLNSIETSIYMNVPDAIKSSISGMRKQNESAKCLTQAHTIIWTIQQILAKYPFNRSAAKQEVRAMLAQLDIALTQNSFTDLIARSIKLRRLLNESQFNVETFEQSLDFNGA